MKQPGAFVESDGSTTQPVSYKHMMNNNGVISVSYTTLPRSMYSRVTVKQGFRTPNYRKLLEDGVIINTPYSKDTLIEEFPPSTYFGQRISAPPLSYYNGSDGSYYWYLMDLGYTDVLPPVLTTQVAAVMDKAKQQAIAHIDRTPYSFMEDLLEARETFSYIKDQYGRAASLTDRFLRKNPSRTAAQRVARRSTDAYLEYRFALSPLLRSATDLYVNFMNPLNEAVRRPARVRASAFVADEGTIATTRVKAPFTFRKVGAWTVSCRAGILYYDSNPATGWRRTFGLRNKDIPVGLWNIVPLSFLADRALDVSTAIKGLTNLADPTLRIEAGWVSTRIWYDVYEECVSQNTADYNVTMSNVRRRMERETLTRFPWSPSVSDTMPRLTPSGLVSDLTSTADLAAILARKLRIV